MNSSDNPYAPYSPYDDLVSGNAPLPGDMPVISLDPFIIPPPPVGVSGNEAPAPTEAKFVNVSIIPPLDARQIQRMVDERLEHDSNALMRTFDTSYRG